MLTRIHFDSLDYNDIDLIPNISDVDSRENVSLTQNFKLNGIDVLTLSIPIIASPMVGIVDSNFAKLFSLLGGIAILPRFGSVEQRKLEIDNMVDRDGIYDYGVAIGINNMNDELDIMTYALCHGVKIICVDIANGYMARLHRFIRDIADQAHKEDVLIISGNVVDNVGACVLENSGVDLIRVNIGTGALCTTRSIAGVGLPPLSALVLSGKGVTNSSLVSDGGIQTSGDAVKAFCFGAKLIMMGSAFGACKEASNSGVIMGMASRIHQDTVYGRHKSIEGISMHIEKTITLSDFLDDFTYGIKSGLSYLGCDDINKLPDMDIKYCRREHI
jgi:IMP dehydrogenase/GMP reductase